MVLLKGHESIIEARLKGYKPEKMVCVDVGTDIAVQRGLLALNGQYIAEDKPYHPQVCLEPQESARTADWSWCVGLSLHVSGNDPARVKAAFQKILEKDPVMLIGFYSNVGLLYIRGDDFYRQISGEWPDIKDERILHGFVGHK